MWYLVDYENAGDYGICDVNMLSQNDKIVLFHRINQELRLKKKSPYIEEMIKKGISIEFIALLTNGKNALDFYIVSKIGEIFGNDKEAKIAIISRDHGFQAVSDYWDTYAKEKKVIYLDMFIVDIVVQLEIEKIKKNGVKISMKDLYLYCLKTYKKEYGTKVYWFIKERLNPKKVIPQKEKDKNNKKYYVVAQGYQPGVYNHISQYNANTKGFPNAYGRVFSKQKDAYLFFEKFNKKNRLKKDLKTLSNHIHTYINQSCYLLKENEAIGFVAGGYDLANRKYLSLVIIIDQQGFVSESISQSNSGGKYCDYGSFAGEIQAVKSCLKSIKRKGYQNVRLYCDTQTVVETIKSIEKIEKNDLLIGLHTVLKNVQKKGLKINKISYINYDEIEQKC